MVLNNVFLLPLLVFVLLPATFVITYLIAISLHHVEEGFPYISDTGNYVPERCIFSLLINIVAFLLAGTMYVRYKQVEQYYRDHLAAESNVVLRLNRIALYFGWFSSFGVTLVANFQEKAILEVHMTGTFIAFGFGTVYVWLHTVMSYFVYPLLNTILIARIRAALSVIITAAFITSTISGFIALHYFHGPDTTKWSPINGGFTSHIISSVAEWVLVLAFDFFVLTYVREMKRISIASPQVQFIVEDHCLPNTDLYHSEDRVDITQSSTVHQDMEMFHPET